MIHYSYLPGGRHYETVKHQWHTERAHRVETDRQKALATQELQPDKPDPDIKPLQNGMV